MAENKKILKKIKKTEKNLDTKIVEKTENLQKKDKKIEENINNTKKKIKKTEKNLDNKIVKNEKAIKGDKKAIKKTKKDLKETNEKVAELAKLINTKLKKHPKKTKKAKVVKKIIVKKAKPKTVTKVKEVTKVIKIDNNTKIQKVDLSKEIKKLKKKLQKKNKEITKLHNKQREIYDNREAERRELEKEIELAKKGSKDLPKEAHKIKEMEEKLKKLETSNKKLEKELEKTQLRLKKKNQNFMTFAKTSKEFVENASMRSSTNVDSEYIIKDHQKEIETLKNKNDSLQINLKGLELEIEHEKKKLDEIKKELCQKDTVIQILEKGEVEIKGIVQTEIDACKVRWLGWPEGGVFEEIDLTLTNNSLESIKNIHVDISITGKQGLVLRLDKAPVKKQLLPKERAHYKIHLFKYVKRRGPYYINVRTYSNDPVRDFDTKEKTIII